jgi:hypothetical protein
MNDRDQIYIQILRFGLLAIRDQASSGNAQYCEIEAEHLHNLPSLIGEPNERRYDYYLDVEKPSYLERVERLPVSGIDFTLNRYAELWIQLEQYRSR